MKTTRSVPKSRHLKQCEVCGDVAYASNFRGISCESCRTFFRRSVARNQKLTCASGEMCRIDIASRRHCARCRMNKCLAIGMMPELICYRRKSPRPAAHQTDSLVPLDAEQYQCSLLSAESSVPLGAIEQQCFAFIRDMCQAFRIFAPQLIGYVSDASQVFYMQQYLLRKAIQFGQSIDGWKRLNQRDQLITLRAAFPEIAVLRMLFYYNEDIDSYAMRVDEDASQAMYVRLGVFYGGNVQLIELHRKLAGIAEECSKDYIIRDLMTTMVLCRQRDQLTKPEPLLYEYHRHQYLLERYLLAKYQNGPKADFTLHLMTQVINGVSKLKSIFVDIYSHIGQDCSDISQSLLEIYDICI